MEQQRHIWRRLLLAVAALLFVSAATSGWWFWREANRELVYRVPPGTIARLAAGEQVEILPPTIELKRGVRDVLIIRNDDVQAITVGPYKIQPGQQFRQRFFNAGTFDMLCTLHESTSLKVVVQ